MNVIVKNNKYRVSIPKEIKMLGLMSFLINMSTLMVFSIFGLYLYNEIGVSLKKIGFLDGTIESISFVMKVLSGIMSDYLMNRKIILCIGTCFLFIAKPLEAVATKFWSLFCAKALERLGNGIHSTPRDTIVGDFAPKEIKGACFGLRQTMAAFGSVCGAIAAYILLVISDENYQFVFWLAAIPSFFGLLISIFLIKDKKIEKCGNVKKFRKISLSDIKNLGTRYWLLIAIASTYMVSKVTESIVILYVIGTMKLPNYIGPACMIFYQVANSFVSYPLGKLSDRIKKRENIFILGLVVFILSDIIFIFGDGISSMISALLFLGIYIGVSQTVFPAKIVDLVPEDLKGTGIGIFNLVCAISLIIGGNFMGYLSEEFSIRTAFVISSILGSVSLLTIFISKKIQEK